MIADIASGHSDAADICFLVATVIAVLAAWNEWPERRMGPALGWVAVAVLSLGWLVT